jgi:hypothetical protein
MRQMRPIFLLVLGAMVILAGTAQAAKPGDLTIEDTIVTYLEDGKKALVSFAVVD